MLKMKQVLPLFLMLLTLTAVVRANALSVDDVRFGIHSDKVRMVLDLSQISDYRVFTLENPYRLIIDMKTFEWRAGKVPKPPQAGIVDIREGPLQPGISRIVFDLNRPVGIQSAFLLPRQGSIPDRLVIDYRSVSGAEFKKGKETILGTLSLTDIQPGETGGSTFALGGKLPPIPGTKPAKQTNKTDKRRIVIDPGHGGVDPGAIGINNIHEKNVVLALSKELKNELENTGRYEVLLTRENDSFVKLANRVSFARKHNANLFVSIHADTIHKPNVSGTSVYTLSKKASDAQTEKLAEKENRADLIAGIDLSTEDEQVVNILYDFARTETMNESKFFANTLVRQMKNANVNLLENPSRHAGFAVLKAPDVPSILIEAGFMSNNREAALLNTAKHRKKIAVAIRKGIDAFFEHMNHNENN
ncbi:MAG: N-acetylmuramoyl-L-alanine amidase [Alphaproteobacteria bacterium]|nr:N-acetylmuramoyl-L-alanine amidase [Alphaproteobacteria bacterium]